MPEIAWSQLHRRFTPGFETLLKQGMTSGWYDPNNTLQLMVFRWVFIPWLQEELNNYQTRLNNTRKRHDRNKVMVTPAAIDHVHELYINPTHTVFDLLPSSLGMFIELCYDQLGRPSVNRHSVWTIYLDLLGLLRRCAEISPILKAADPHVTIDDELPLLPGLQELPLNEMDTH
ncbi:hypothetical protein PAXRUDRAFT_13542 [Paxillus rubicundulus Ve08.2h10]|uniref:Uncharacterized protein n=1 Tax=Paxillus rubicundulus Ve08.2h10 TaxID=930991 RepID=A0A0D0DKY3_9AGAM|nr:hypothetical protein PAXRUDRAFT_13542 [Paxillus rubicundulus Ve08.2h10]